MQLRKENKLMEEVVEESSESRNPRENVRLGRAIFILEKDIKQLRSSYGKYVQSERMTPQMDIIKETLYGMQSTIKRAFRAIDK